MAILENTNMFKIELDDNLKNMGIITNKNTGESKYVRSMWLYELYKVYEKCYRNSNHIFYNFTWNDVLNELYVNLEV